MVLVDKKKYNLAKHEEYPRIRVKVEWWNLRGGFIKLTIVFFF